MIQDLGKLHPLTKELLFRRGVQSLDEVNEFLFPSYENHIGYPFGIHGMQEAVNRIVEALKNEEDVVIYSDYDCDGVPGGVLLRTFFDDIGYPVEVYIPHRHKEGYGLHRHAFDSLKEKGVSLVITVDSGITNIDEVAYAKSLGIDVIVTDHHLPITKVTEEGGVTQVLPNAVAVLNSKQDVCTYEDDMLCGCAVAWKLACALLATLRKEGRDGENKSYSVYFSVLEKVKMLKEGHEKWYLDLVAISTIADMVPLQKENRALAHFGLKVLRKTRRPGLLHILTEQKILLSQLQEDDIAFTIAPRINAGSRMGDPIQAHMMLYEQDRESAEGYAEDLEELNFLRKNEVKDIVSMLSFDHKAYDRDVIVVGDLSWGPGVLGLIAQKIIDETKKPVFVFGYGEAVPEDQEQRRGIILKGSCRSPGEVSVVDLMAYLGKEEEGGVLVGYGGHEGAGGFSLREPMVPLFVEKLQEAYAHVEKRDLSTKASESDAMLTFNDIHDVTYDAVAVLAPFGEGNPKPVFTFCDAEALVTKWFGKKGEHFEIVYVNSSGKRIKAIQFFAKKDIEEKVAKKHTLLAHLEKSYFGGKVELRLRIVEVK